MDFQVCVNCDKGVPGHPVSHLEDCPRPKYKGEPDPDSPIGRPEGEE